MSAFTTGDAERDAGGSAGVSGREGCVEGIKADSWEACDSGGWESILPRRKRDHDANDTNDTNDTSGRAMGRARFAGSTARWSSGQWGARHVKGCDLWTCGPVDPWTRGRSRAVTTNGACRVGRALLPRSVVYVGMRRALASACSCAHTATVWFRGRRGNAQRRDVTRRDWTCGVCPGVRGGGERTGGAGAGGWHWQSFPPSC